jgi:hypothetical protein
VTVPVLAYLPTQASQTEAFPTRCQTVHITGYSSSFNPSLSTTMEEAAEDARANTGRRTLITKQLGLVDFILPSQVRRQARGHLAKIWENWTTLGGILERHELTIQRRWMSKSKVKRRDILLFAWPGMATKHNPHILESRRCNRKGTTKSGMKRDCFMFPYINLEDLMKTEPLRE